MNSMTRHRVYSWYLLCMPIVASVGCWDPHGTGDRDRDWRLYYSLG